MAIGAAPAIAHLNQDHADALLLIARALGGHPDATTARCRSLDRYGIDLTVTTPHGPAPARVEFPDPLSDRSQLRAATVALTHRARAVAAAL